MIKTKVRQLIASLGDLDAEKQVHAEVALRLASILDGKELPLYAAGTTARALSAELAILAGSLPPGGPRGVSDDDLDALLGGVGGAS